MKGLESCESTCELRASDSDQCMFFWMRLLPWQEKKGARAARKPALLDIASKIQKARRSQSIAQFLKPSGGASESGTT